MPSLSLLGRFRGKSLADRRSDIDKREQTIFCRTVLKMDFVFRPAGKMSNCIARWLLVIVNEYGCVAKWMPCESPNPEVAAFALKELRTRHVRNGIPTCRVIYTDNYCCSEGKWGDVWRTWNSEPVVRLDFFHFLRRLIRDTTSGKHNAWTGDFVRELTNAFLRPLNPSDSEDSRRTIPDGEVLDTSVLELFRRFENCVDSGVSLLLPDARSIYEAKFRRHIMKGCISDPECLPDMYIEEPTAEGTKSRFKALRSTGQVEAVNRLLREFVSAPRYSPEVWDSLIATRIDNYNTSQVNRFAVGECPTTLVFNSSDSSGIRMMRRYEDERLSQLFRFNQTYGHISCDVDQRLCGIVEDGVDEGVSLLQMLHMQYGGEPPQRPSLTQANKVIHNIRKERRKKTNIPMKPDQLPKTTPPSPLYTMPASHYVPAPPRLNDTIARPALSVNRRPASRNAKLGREHTKTVEARRRKWQMDGETILKWSVPDDVQAYVRRHPHLYFTDEDKEIEWEYVVSDMTCRTCGFPNRRPFHVVFFQQPGRNGGIRLCTTRCLNPPSIH